MPELPEAETIVRDLRDRIVGHAVTGIAVIRPDILAPGLTPDHLERRTSSFASTPAASSSSTSG